MAKALGNGVPIGACWARAEVAAAFSPGDHGSTFGGQPLAAAAARATLAVMEAEDVPARARAGRGAAAGRARGARRRRRGARGAGSCSARRSTTQRAKEVVAAALARGLVVNAPRPDTIRLAPSLLVSDAEIDEGLALLAAALADVARCARASARVVTRHFLDVDDLSCDELDDVLATAVAPRGRGCPRCWPGGVPRFVFEKPSARTRSSTELAVVALGGHPVYIQGRRGRHRRARDGRGRGPDPGVLPRRAVRARARPHHAGAHGGRPRRSAADGGTAERRRDSRCRCPWSTCSRTGPIRARPWPTC